MERSVFVSLKLGKYRWSHVGSTLRSWAERFTEISNANKTIARFIPTTGVLTLFPTCDRGISQNLLDANRNLSFD